MLKRYFMALAAVVLLSSSMLIAEDETLFNLTSGGKDIVVSIDGDTVTMSVKTGAGVEEAETTVIGDQIMVDEVVDMVEAEVVAAKVAEATEVAETVETSGAVEVTEVEADALIPVMELSDEVIAVPEVPAVVVVPAVKVSVEMVDAENAVVVDAEESSSAISGSTMGMLFFVFILAIFLGVELIAKVPSQLHTPLMSGSNAISGITVVGALLAVRSSVASGNEKLAVFLGVVAVAFAMINVVGGYLVTDRMLGMFKHKD